MIKLFKPYIPKQEVIEGIKEVFDSDCITEGPKVKEFEKNFCELFQKEYAVSLNSGTSALDTAYDLVGLKGGDEVISTPLTCAATNISLLRRGVKIIWADILEDTLCINPLDVLSKITKKTKAIAQVHLGGVQADVGKVHLPVISDACQALGIFTGDYTACSFQAIKHVSCGDGGMLIVNKEEDYKKAKLLRWFGIDREKKINYDWESYRTRMMCFDIELPGTKRHMNDITAAMGLAGLRYYQKNIEHRHKIFSIYKDRLSNVKGVKIIDGKNNVYWLATLLVEKRDRFAKKLWELGIESNVVQIRNDVYKIFGGKKAALPILNSVEDKYISIPIGMHVSEEDANIICDVIKKGEWYG